MQATRCGNGEIGTLYRARRYVVSDYFNDDSLVADRSAERRRATARKTTHH